MGVPAAGYTVCFTRRRIAPNRSDHNHRRVKCYGNGQPPSSTEWHLFIRAGHAARCLMAANGVIKHAFGCGSIDARLHVRPLT